MTGRVARSLLWLSLGLAACRDDRTAESSAGSSPRPPAPRHLVVLTLDTLRADRVGCYGNPRGLTPNLDGVAADGVRVTLAMTPITCTAPSHTTLFTGLHPLAHGLTDNFHRLDESVETLAETLAAQGFQTAAFFHRYQFPANQVTQGFQYLGFDESEVAATTASGLDRYLTERGPARAGADPTERHFLWVHLFVPHAPMESPPEYQQRWVEHPYTGPLGQDHRTLELLRKGILTAPDDYYDHFRDGYDADVALTDDRVGEILAVLEQRGILDAALLVVAADHGESLAKGTAGMHSPVIRDHVLHVPLLLRGAGLPAGSVVDVLVSLTEVYPTVLDVLEVTSPLASASRSLRPLLMGEGADLDEHVFSMLPTEYIGRQATGFEAEPPALAVRTRRWKLVRRGGRRELYDLAADRDEQQDVAAGHPDVVASMSAALDRWVQSLTRAGSTGEGVSDEELEYLRGLGYVTGDEEDPDGNGV